MQINGQIERTVSNIPVRDEAIFEPEQEGLDRRPALPGGSDPVEGFAVVFPVQVDRHRAPIADDRMVDEIGSRPESGDECLVPALQRLETDDAPSGGAVRLDIGMDDGIPSVELVKGITLVDFQGEVRVRWS